jgi:hypothetical protein
MPSAEHGFEKLTSVGSWQEQFEMNNSKRDATLTVRTHPRCHGHRCKLFNSLASRLDQGKREEV